MSRQRDIMEQVADWLAARSTAPDERAFNQDVSAQSTATLLRQRWRLRLAIQISSRPRRDDLERLALIEFELRARHGR